MDSTALSEALAALNKSQRKALLKDASLVRVYPICETIPDPRRPQGRRYDLASLLTCLAAAMLCNRNATLAVAEWCRAPQDLLAPAFGSGTWYCPDASLYRKWLPRLDSHPQRAGAWLLEPRAA